MTSHGDGVVCDIEEVHLDAGQQAKLVRVLVLELLRCLEAVDKLRHLLLLARPSADTVHHLHLQTRVHQHVPLHVGLYLPCFLANFNTSCTTKTGTNAVQYTHLLSRS